MPVNNEVDEKDVFEFLVRLRDSGRTNMFGAGPYIEAEYGVSAAEGRRLLAVWIESFND